MSDMIKILEQIGQDPCFGDPTRIGEILAASDVDEHLKAALMHGDGEALARQLGVKLQLMSVLVPADDDEGGDQDDGGEAPDQDDSGQEIFN